MNTNLMNPWGRSRVPNEYYVFHKQDPKNGVIVRSLEKLTAKSAKDKACSNGLFSKNDRAELRVKKKGR